MVSRLPATLNGRWLAMPVAAALAVALLAVPATASAAAAPAAARSLGPPNTWVPAGPMRAARAGQTATLLPDGKVLVAGGGCNGTKYGCDSGSFLSNLSSAERYDPASAART